MLVVGTLIARSACLLVLASPPVAAPPQSGPVINAQRELTINAVGVVDGPVLAGDVPPAQFVEQWLDTNITTQVVNTYPINEPGKALAFQAFKLAWLNGGSTLNLNEAQFRLLAPGNAVYNSSLQAITDAITLPHPGSGKPNGSYLKQLRTNEFELGDSSPSWNLREWNLISTGGPNEAQLRSVTTKQTPHFNYLKTADGRLMLREYLDLNRAAILAGNHSRRPSGTAPS